MYRPKEQTRPSAYRFERGGIAFYVVLFRIHNTINGGPRYQAVITWQRPGESFACARVFNFRGSYINESQEASEVLDYMLSTW